MAKLPLNAISSQLVFALSMLLFVGCSNQPETFPVQGRVVFPDGKPVHAGMVEFRSQESRINARGAIQNDGSFSLSTFNKDDGAVAGLHDCVVSQLVITEDIGDHKPSTYGVVDRKHASYATSGLTANVSPVQVNEVRLVVERIRKDAGASAEKHEHDGGAKNLNNPQERK